jgi:hypothetical protein
MAIDSSPVRPSAAAASSAGPRSEIRPARGLRDEVADALPIVAELQSVRCGAHGHREFVLRYDERRTSSVDVARILASLEEAVAHGLAFAPGDEVRLGWTPLRIVDAGGALALAAPSLFAALPGAYIDSIDEAVAHFRAQQAFADAAALAPSWPALGDRATVCTHLDGRGFVIDRRPPRVPSSPSSAAGHSGFRIGCGHDAAPDDDPDQDFDAHPTIELSLFDVIRRYPSLLEFFALPPGTTAACTSAGAAAVWHDGLERLRREPVASARPAAARDGSGPSPAGSRIRARPSAPGGARPPKKGPRRAT